MAGGFDEKSGGAQMGVMQGPMVSADETCPLYSILLQASLGPGMLQHFLNAVTSDEASLNRNQWIQCFLD